MHKKQQQLNSPTRHNTHARTQTHYRRMQLMEAIRLFFCLCVCVCVCRTVSIRAVGTAVLLQDIIIIVYYRLLRHAGST